MNYIELISKNEFKLVELNEWEEKPNDKENTLGKQKALKLSFEGIFRAFFFIEMILIGLKGI